MTTPPPPPPPPPPQPIALNQLSASGSTITGNSFTSTKPALSSPTTSSSTSSSNSITQAQNNTPNSGTTTNRPTHSNQQTNSSTLPSVLRLRSIVNPDLVERKGPLIQIERFIAEKSYQRRKREFPNLDGLVRDTPIDDGIAPRSDANWAPPSTEEVYDAARAHLKYRTNKDDPDEEDVDLLEFDNTQKYQFDPEECDTMLKKEVERLLVAVRNPSELQFTCGSFENLPVDKAYAMLADIAEKLQCTFAISALDNECIIYDLLPSISDEEDLRKAYGSLEQYIKELFKDGLDVDAPTNNLDADYIEAFDALLDFMTALMAILFVKTAHGSYWNKTVLGGLAKWTTKIRVLLRNICEFATTSLMDTKTLVDEKNGRFNYKEGTVELSAPNWRPSRRQQEDSSLGFLGFDADSKLMLHVVSQINIRRGLRTIANYLSFSLRSLNRGGFPLTSYDICAVVYEAGFEGFKALVYHDRQYEFTATSDLNNLNVAYATFGMLNDILLKLDSSQRVTTPPPSASTGQQDAPARPEATIEWSYVTKNPPINSTQQGNQQANHQNQSTNPTKRSLKLTTMAEIVTAMLPLAACSPVPLNLLNQFRHMVALSGDGNEVVRPFEEKTFDANFRMFTEEATQRACSMPAGVLHLSGAVEQALSRRQTFPLAPVANVPPHNTTNSNQQSYTLPTSTPAITRNRDDDDGFKQYEKKLAEITKEMDSWVFTDKSIVVRRPAFVYFSIFIAAFLICGGLGIGFTVQQRIQGVDPFSITTYCWVLAAFVILIAKSIMIETWSWHSFLHREVNCRSVSELQNTTGINDQLILAKLLHDEENNMLVTTGPYNTVFRRRSGTGEKAVEGFSIDTPIHSRTLLRSGIILLRVQTPDGAALVCLDARRNTDCAVVEHRTRGKKTHLVCKDVSYRKIRSSIERSRDGNVTLRLIHSDELQWIKVQGVFEGGYVVFQ
ncbi:hypothetical protein BJ508DRAFT_236344 [Ascobolus immersus RN42]|uniref:Uncharacterized protein n=1 Tax=Ascobolus immersus RN42 TaxID=1160509 RepID=A0A3N4IG28_ASCIM|nr:hypothetical protein BJ508DRAFT_236344 [Ascobolus immersus RN42]